jgi:hypothetical protein
MISALQTVFPGRSNLRRLARSVWQRIGGTAQIPVRDDWSIGIYQGKSPFHLAPSDMAHNPVLTAKDVKDITAAYVADPFMIRIDGTWYLFFEILNQMSERGEIGLATSKDALTWTYQRRVLAEPFHLSYPYVFESQGEFFMVPETFQTDTIRLYKADSFPFQWSFVSTLIIGKDLVDPSIAHYRDKWWLFASSGIHPFRAENLHLFYADDLLGTWQEHHKSPVIRGNMKIARPGGRVINYEDKLFRYAQDCAQTYGRQVGAFEITDLTQDRYSERAVSEEPIVKPAKHGWNQMGMHHIDPHPLADGTWIACVDGWRWIEST